MSRVFSGETLAYVTATLLFLAYIIELRKDWGDHSTTSRWGLSAISLLLWLATCGATRIASVEQDAERKDLGRERTNLQDILVDLSKRLTDFQQAFPSKNEFEEFQGRILAQLGRNQIKEQLSRLKSFRLEIIYPANEESPEVGMAIANVMKKGGFVREVRTEEVPDGDLDSGRGYRARFYRMSAGNTLFFPAGTDYLNAANLASLVKNEYPNLTLKIVPLLSEDLAPDQFVVVIQSGDSVLERPN